MNVKDYYRIHPDASLKEYIEAEEEESKKRKKELEQLEENKNKWYENLIGKYFILKFNFEVTGFVYIDKSLFEQNSRNFDSGYTLYEKYKSRDKISVSIEKHRHINPLWINNPYITYGQSDIAKEISKEEYDKIVEEIEKFLQCI